MFCCIHRFHTVLTTFKVMVLFNEVKSESAAYSYEQTLLGSLLAMSSWPRYGHNTADFFEDVADTDDARIQPINEYIWQVQSGWLKN